MLFRSATIDSPVVNVVIVSGDQWLDFLHGMAVEGGLFAPDSFFTPDRVPNPVRGKHYSATLWPVSHPPLLVRHRSHMPSEFVRHNPLFAG